MQFFIIKKSAYCMFLFVVACFFSVCHSNNGSPYDTSITLFSNTGELHQVSYARLAGLQGETVLCGVDSDNKEIMMCYKVGLRNHKLLDRNHVEKLTRIDDHIYMSFAGLAGDGRALVNRARDYCVEFYAKFGMKPSVYVIASKIGEWQHDATLYGGKRPLGIQVLIMGKDLKTGELQLYKTEPSGLLERYHAVAIGKDSDKLMDRLEDRWINHKTHNTKWFLNIFKAILIGSTTVDDIVNSKIFNDHKEKDSEVLEFVSIKSKPNSDRIFHEYVSE